MSNNQERHEVAMNVGRDLFTELVERIQAREQIRFGLAVIKVAEFVVDLVSDKTTSAEMRMVGLAVMGHILEKHL
tara:strand:+ start:442 stop:666 length:225 start_codon:yes stop_codon:yes gene_type:complete